MKRITTIIILAAAAIFFTSCGKDDGEGASKGALLTVIEKAKTLQESTYEGVSAGQYRIGSKAAFQTAIDAAEAVYRDASATQGEVDTACTLLETAITTFELQKIVNKASLYDLIGICKELAGWTIIPGEGPAQDDIEALNAAIASAEAYIAAHPNMSQSEVDEQYAALWLAKTAFEKKLPKSDKEALGQMISDAEELLNGATEGNSDDQYPAGSKSVLKDAIDDAKEVYDNATAIQSEVDNAVTALETAMNGFQAKKNPDRSALLQIIEDAKALAVSGAEGPAQSDINALQNAITAAETGLSSYPAMTQDDIDGLYAALEAAVALFKSKISTGGETVTVGNHSFEFPGVKDAYFYGSGGNDWTLVTDWMDEGYIVNDGPNWVEAPNQIAKAGTHGMYNYAAAPDGSYALGVSNYCLRVWQKLSENVAANTTYAITFTAARMSPATHADTKLLVQFLVFNATDGNFGDITVVGETILDAVSSWDAFADRSASCTVAAGSSAIGKPLVIAFRSFIGTTPPANTGGSFVWVNDGGTVIDNVRLTRE